ncbi:class I adenylate-forming enzyme family protein [Mycobacterium marinum]|uniref:class I adenylate-forming enzyme family protein n=1 Tax=Mycobacterium marinum TaxID=1781 RepID=UPI0023588697|nr:class I adenylate-forming enzyme family protein [Mycobacterium marinum]MDC8972738.1 class I adenylate-forming enzyme family protein [Mycobacterium marinum]
MAADSPTVAQILRRQARCRPDHPFLVCDSDRISYAQADLRSAELARGLIALGIGKAAHVGLLYPNGSDFVIGMLAAARIGAVVIPISTFVTPRELHEQLVDSDTQILLSADTFRSHDYAGRLRQLLGDTGFDGEDRLFSRAIPQLRTAWVSYRRGAPRRTRSIECVYRLSQTIDPTMLRALEDDVDGSDVLAIVYTSGTTSAPKGVVHTHSALLRHQQNLNVIRGLGTDDKLFCNSPFCWIGGFAFGLLATLLAGSTLVCSNADAATTLDLLEREKPTMTNGFASTVAWLANHPSFGRRDLSSMRRGNLYPIMAPEARPVDPELRHNMLGMTEAGSIVLISADESDQPESRRGSFGKPAPGFDTIIIEPGTGEVANIGQVGELCIRGPFVMQGYYKRSREECFDADGWFHTGDLVRADQDGYMYFTGRLSSLIKTAGANVSPAEVERAIAKLGMVAHVVGIPDPQRGQVVAAVLVVADGVGALDELALRERLETELSAYKIPTRFATLPPSEIPLLSSGKVDTHQLKKCFDA